MTMLHVNENNNTKGGFILNKDITRAIKINNSMDSSSQDFICTISPNPCSSQAIISYAIQNDANVKIQLYNIRGQLIEILKDDVENVGNKYFNLNTDHLNNGIYFCRITAGKQSKNVKLLIMK